MEKLSRVFPLVKMLNVIKERSERPIRAPGPLPLFIQVLIVRAVPNLNIFIIPQVRNSRQDAGWRTSEGGR
jgi:hypothetical protein